MAINKLALMGACRCAVLSLNKIRVSTEKDLEKKLKDSPLPDRHKRKMHEISKNTFGIHTPMAGDIVPVSQIPLAPARHI